MDIDASCEIRTLGLARSKDWAPGILVLLAFYSMATALSRHTTQDELDAYIRMYSSASIQRM